MENNLVATDEQGKLMLMNTAQMSYCSITADSKEAKAKLFNIINNPEERLADHVNTEVRVTDVYCETVTFIDEETGEGTPGVRTILVDENGKAYAAAAKGVFSSLQKLIRVFGEPTWEDPITIVPRILNKGAKKKILVFDIKM